MTQTLLIKKVLAELKADKSSAEVSEITTAFLADCIAFWATVDGVKEIELLNKANAEMHQITSNPNHPNGSFDYPVTKDELQNAKKFSSHLLQQALNTAIAQIADEC